MSMSTPRQTYEQAVAVALWPGESVNRTIRGYIGTTIMGYIGTTIMGYIGTTIRGYIGTTIMGYIGTDSFFGKSAASVAVLEGSSNCRGRRTCVETPSHSNLRVVRLYLLLPTRSMRLVTGLWLARNEGMDPYSSPYITHYSRFHFLFHSFLSSKPKARWSL